ncbi:MAG: hypothetical protein ACRERC_18045, partial [Candidatus Binatia bacterium]
PAPAPPAAPRRWRTALLLFLALFVIYVGNFRLRGAGDSIPTRLLPFSLLREGNLDLDEFTWQRSKRGRLPYYVHQRGAHIYSVSTIATSLVITPLYVLPAWWLAAAEVGYDDVRARVVVTAMERISAALLTALSAALLYLVLGRLTTPGWALTLAVVYALGTNTWVISSQALWPHTLSELALVILCAVLLQAAPSRAALAWAGVVAAVAVANRPQMVIFAALALGFVWVHHRRHVAAFVAVPVLVGVALLAYNQTVFSGLTGGYGGFRQFDGRLFEGIAGLFVSPNRGLFVFTPIMLFAVWGAVRVWRIEVPAWLRWLSLGVVAHVLLHAKFREWWGGYTYGPRYLTDVVPALTLFLVYGLVPLCRARAWRAVGAVLAVYGIAIQAIGVYAADDGWNREPAPLERRPNRVWDWSDLQIVRGLRSGWHGGEFALVMVDAFRDAVPAQLAALNTDGLRTELHAQLPARMAPGSTVRRIVSVTNRSPVAWPAFNGEGVISARYLVFLMVRWMEDGQLVAGVGDILPLPENLAPDETVRMRIPLTAPLRAGRYQLDLRVTQGIDGRRGMASPDGFRGVVVVE